MVDRRKNPCNGCPNVGCGVYHDKCPEYQAFRAELEKDYIKRKEISNRKHDMTYVITRNVDAAKRFHKTK